MINDLEKLISRNNIDIEKFQQDIYITLLLNIFEVICLKMKDLSIRQNILSEFRKSCNHENTVKDIVLKYTGCKVSSNESRIIGNWIIAYFRKNGKRKTYDKKIRKKLLEDQGDKCKICGKNIFIDDSELDHIIPWDFVGDELEDNLQMLCCNCNERKGRNIDFQLKMLLVNNDK